MDWHHGERLFQRKQRCYQLFEHCSKGFVRCKVCCIPTTNVNSFCPPCYTSLTRKTDVCLMCLKDSNKGKRVRSDVSYWYCDECSLKDEVKGLLNHPQLYSNGSSDRSFPLYQKIGLGLYWIYGYTADTPLKNRIMWWTPTANEERKFFKVEAAKIDMKFDWGERKCREKIVYTNKDKCKRVTSLDPVELALVPALFNLNSNSVVGSNSHSGIDDDFLKQRLYFMCLYGFTQFMG